MEQSLCVHWKDITFFLVWLFYQFFGLFSPFSEVDGNAEYDSLEILGQDEEEKYFDDESPESIQSEDSSGHTDSKRQMEVVEDYELYNVEETKMEKGIHDSDYEHNNVEETNMEKGDS